MSTGTDIDREDLVIVIWLNPERTSNQARAIETITPEDSNLPIAFPARSLDEGGSRLWQRFFEARTREDVYILLPRTTRLEPLVVPVPIAEEALGWLDFYIIEKKRGTGR